MATDPIQLRQLLPLLSGLTPDQQPPQAPGIAAPGPEPRAYRLPGIQPTADATAGPLRAPGIAPPSVPTPALMPPGASMGPLPTIAAPKIGPSPAALGVQQAKQNEAAIKPPSYTGKLGVLEKIGDTLGRVFMPGLEQRLGVGTVGYQDRLAQAQGQTDRAEKQAATEAATGKTGADAELADANANRVRNEPTPEPTPEQQAYDALRAQGVAPLDAMRQVVQAATKPTPQHLEHVLLAGPDGKPIEANYDPVSGHFTTGAGEPITSPQPYQAPAREPVTDLDAFTKQYLHDNKLADTAANRLAAKNAWGHAGAVDAGEGWAPLPTAASAAQVPAQAAPDPFGGTPTGRDVSALAGLTPGQANIVRGIDEGRISGEYLLRYGKQNMEDILGRVTQYDPSFDAINYNARAKTRQAFTSGVPAQQVNALNTGIGHLAQLTAAADALGNGNLTPVNSLKNWFSQETGHPAVTNFQTVLNQVAPEIVKIWRGTGGAESDIDRQIQALKSSSSPAQLHGAIAQLADLMLSKISALQNQYEQGMGVKNVNMLTPQAEATIQALSGRSSKAVTQAELAAVAKASFGGDIKKAEAAAKAQGYTIHE